MKFLLIVLLTLVALATTIAGAFEILGFRVGPLDAPRWIAVWQYGLALMACCGLIAFEPNKFKESAWTTLRLLSFPLFIWALLGIFPSLTAIWVSGWGMFLKFFSSVVVVVIDIYVCYLITRYLMVQLKPGLMVNRAGEPRSPADR